MPTARRRRLHAGALAGLAAASLGAAPAGAAPALETPACVGHQGDARTLAVKGSGFAPGSRVSLRYEAPHLGEPRSAALVTPDASGVFSAELVPPPLASARTQRGSFVLSAVDPLMPALTAAATIEEVRVGLTVRPRTATSASRRALYSARGFEEGATVYAHFRRPGGRARTVSLGRARGPCGTISRRMSLVPGRRVSRGAWFVAVDAERRYSSSTSPQAGAQVIVQRPRR